ncbi:MAG: hypothetical protein ACI835_004681 [Planctomycetota bacterium]|jgi:hypothetical protein
MSSTSPFRLTLRYTLYLASSFPIFPSLGAAQSTEQAVLRASDAATASELGDSAAISGNRAIVGAPADGHSGVTEAGSAYVYARTGVEWLQDAKLVASDASMPDQGGVLFGASVAMSSDTLLVGTPRNDHSGFVDAGAVYVFVHDGANWIEQAKLTASDAATSDGLGVSVALEGNTAIVGATRGGASGAGAVYVFQRSATTWSEQAKLIASDNQSGSNFGSCVAIDGETFVSGSAMLDHSGLSNSGAVYVFSRAAGVWTEQARLVAPDAERNDHLGASVSISGVTIVAGADGDDYAGNVNAGSARVFVGSGANWTEEATLTGSSIGTSDRFGRSVSLSGNQVGVGADRDGHTGGAEAGSAFMFRRNGTVWTEELIVRAADTAATDHFGASVSFDGQNLLVGSPWNDISCLTNSGSAYVYVFDGTGSTTPYCFCDCSAPCGNLDATAGCANSTGSGALLHSTGSTSVIADDLVLTVSNLPSNQFGILYRGGRQWSATFGDGIRCVGAAPLTICRFGVQSSGPSGTLVLGPGIVALSSTTLPECHIQAGMTWNFQGWFRDPGGPCGSAFNLSNALAVTFSL